MVNNVNEIHAAAEALVADMERAAALASDLAALLDQAHAQVAMIEDKAGSLYTSTIDRLTTFHGQISDQVTRMTEAGSHYQGLLDEAEAHVQEAISEFDQAGQALHASLQTLSTQVETLGTNAHQAAEAAVVDIGGLADKLTEAAQAIGDNGKEGADRLHDLETAAMQMYNEWQGFVSELEQRLEHSLADVTNHIDQAVVSELSEHVQSFLSSLEQVAQSVIEEPLRQLQDEMVSTISDEFTQIADQAIQAVDEEFKKIIEDVLGARDRGDIEEKLMHELFEQLRPIFDAVEDQFHVVQSIASAVGAN